jgi:hypothetical protein
MVKIIESDEEEVEEREEGELLNEEDDVIEDRPKSKR